ncbi:MAG: orotidine-5'-phosphate decarboxylase [Candidatus Marinimicrobia bacterium]|jgi:orotidine-5'-phosphate decarboxylase|nr:orotidine-5'-phosphate decarboxylase [Candidatus Neomarinimicrobiota bacterium]MBT3634054.1 orotidine-5'-phosphate decarboxylase [Candidatus Neomarinimicrobiota bacterium]MBT3683072.1 orotidine-5'-phosphate decarboxylase [Candidatus Neomarinimicrobiota bacterium]MBT3759836.1 orotidine-5'-phosphate decarboxylase [Candidatus Neomarinimicrobiota bacterium]MBT3895711.1 orotidine-5'-phosphate decarboxylase [Candidatus Neomarinimicrobiota bacterium]
MEIAFNNRLEKACNDKKTVLCLGLDVDYKKLPPSNEKELDYLERFSKNVIDCTIDLCPVYKVNLAFYERHGSRGVKWLENLMAYINKRAIVIADAKRGDIGNTSIQYARSLFSTMGFDAATISPYMGRDSILPFIEDKTKGAFVLALTSNPGAADFQFFTDGTQMLFQKVANLVTELNKINNNLGIVVGATKADMMTSLRKSSPGLSWLIPGIGAQGGDLKQSVEIGNKNGIGLINVSRGILYAGSSSQDDIRKAALSYTSKIRNYL